MDTTAWAAGASAVRAVVTTTTAMMARRFICPSREQSQPPTELWALATCVHIGKWSPYTRRSGFKNGNRYDRISTVTTALHVRGVVLPDEEHRDLWIVDGRISFNAVADATTVGEGWLLPGLVDAHCHIGLDSHGPVERDVQEQQAMAERDAGVLLARDCGVPSDTRWMDERADLPRIVRAGQHVARTKRYLRNYGVEVEPEDLVETVAEQARRGDGWVKIVGDWIDREIGDLGPCWPADVLRDAVSRAHELGARVTTHVFGEAALPDLLAAGVDCLEHGTGLSDDQIAAMAAHG